MKPSERINVLAGNLDFETKQDRAWKALLAYLDEEWEKDMNTGVSCDSLGCGVYHTNGHTKRDFLKPKE